MNPWFRVSWHHELVARKLEAVQRGEIKRLIINMPPRHSKSEMVSRCFPPWCLGLNPNEQIIACSYNDVTARDFARDVQGLLRRPEFMTAFPFAHERHEGRYGRKFAANARKFEMGGGRGYYLAAGVGSGITGQGATIGLIDDPIKNHEEAYSQTYRDRVWNWYTSTFYTRGEGSFATGGDFRIIVCATRWHQDDLAGRLLDEGGWDSVDLPAILDTEPTPGDPRDPGDALWSEKYNTTLLQDIRKRVGSRDWLSLYQQRPTAITGNMFKRAWWRFYDDLPTHFDTVFTSWDMTFKETQTGSFVVGQVWGRKGIDIYLIDQVRGRFEFVVALREFIKTAQAHRMAMTHLIEEKANGAAVISMLRDRVPGLKAVQVEGSKEARAAAVTAIVESGCVYLPRRAPWIDDYLDEVSTFPGGKYDDQVDATTQALRYSYSTASRGFEELASL